MHVHIELFMVYGLVRFNVPLDTQ